MLAKEKREQLLLDYDRSQDDELLKQLLEEEQHLQLATSAQASGS